jgi:hypothetical protein
LQRVDEALQAGGQAGGRGAQHVVDLLSLRGERVVARVARLRRIRLLRQLLIVGARDACDVDAAADVARAGELPRGLGQVRRLGTVAGGRDVGDIVAGDVEGLPESEQAGNAGCQ